ncbi:DUF4190 domain-containing protein [Streptomyces hyaluromycini]|uniref:DUF4190 domain-containing protein n=1 Tax=Streptomyces hyaluromycini TaxID=1377993 RepID=UPI001238211A|nr:DUF4190 domain-containing protein [Streptomyces hyaluromycini]
MADEVPQAPKVRLDKGEDVGEGAGPDAPVIPPSVHDQRTVAAIPGPDASAGAPPQGWASPIAAPSDMRPAPPANPFAAPDPAAPPPNPYAPPAPQQPQQPQSAAVPPPPIAPNGPGQVPYGYPGGPVSAPPAPGYGYPGQPLPSYPAAGPGGYGGWPGMQPAPDNGLGTAAMVTGIISAIGFCLAPVALVMGVLAIVFGSIGRARVKRGVATNGGQALAGIICGSAGLVLAAAFITLIVVAGSQGSQ